MVGGDKMAVSGDKIGTDVDDIKYNDTEDGKEATYNENIAVATT